MGTGFHMTLGAHLSDVARVHATFANFATAHRVPPDVRRSLQVVLDELLANIVTHGLTGCAGGEATIDVVLSAEALVVTLADNGPPFDPLGRAAPDTTLPVADRQIGGLGVHLARQMMDEVRYDRRDDRNVTVLLKRITEIEGTSRA